MPSMIYKEVNQAVILCGKQLNYVGKAAALCPVLLIKVLLNMICFTYENDKNKQ